MPTEFICDNAPDGSFLYKAHDSDVPVRAYFSHRKPKGLSDDGSFLIIPHPSDKLGDVALRASFANSKLKGTLYGPEEYVYPKRWHKFRLMNTRFIRRNVVRARCAALARESKDEPDFSAKMENGRSKYPKYCKEDIDPKSSETKKKGSIRSPMPMRGFNIFVWN